MLSSAWGRRPAAPDRRSPASCLERGGYAAVPRTSAFPRFRGSSAPAGGFGGDGPLHPWARAHLGPGAHLGPHYRDSPLLPQGLLTPFGFGRGLPSWLALVVALASASGPPRDVANFTGSAVVLNLVEAGCMPGPIGAGPWQFLAIDGIARCFPLGPA